MRRFESARARLGPPDPERLHRLRVAARRLLAGAPPGPARRAIKALFKRTGPWRDLDIAEAWIARHGDAAAWRKRHPGPARRDLERLRRSLSAVRGLPEPGSAKLKLGRLKRLLERALEKPDAPRRQHEVRLAVKRLRYALELLDPSSRLLQPARSAQKALGERHDLEVVWGLMGPPERSRLRKAWREDRRKRARQARRRMQALLDVLHCL